jgi:hypothetical protein
MIPAEIQIIYKHTEYKAKNCKDNASGSFPFPGNDENNNQYE